MHRLLFLVVVGSFLFFGTTSAQTDVDVFDAPPTHMKERAFSFSLSTSGLGLGGTYRFPLPSYSHIGFNLEFFILRDDKEFEYYNQLYNISTKINNVNRFFIVPANVELKKRLFTNTIEDNFRPHLMVQAGAVFGMNFPREDAITLGEAEGGNIPTDNQYQVTYNAVFGFGVDVSTRKNYFVTIRPQYRLTFFQDEIAGDKNHSAFEIKFEIGGQY